MHNNPIADAPSSATLNALFMQSMLRSSHHPFSRQLLSVVGTGSRRPPGHDSAAEDIESPMLFSTKVLSSIRLVVDRVNHR